MKAFRLDIGALSVDSFDTAAFAGTLGTVHGRQEDEENVPVLQPVSPSFRFSCDLCPVTIGVRCERTWVACNVVTDPCLCDPVQPSLPCIEAGNVHAA